LKHVAVKIAKNKVLTVFAY